MHRPELDGNKQKQVEHTGNYGIVQGLGSVNPHSYPYRHVRASDHLCQRQSDVKDQGKPLEPTHPYAAAPDATNSSVPGPVQHAV